MGALVIDSGRKPHHSNDDLVIQAGIMDALTGPFEVIDIVESVEVAD